MTTERPNRAERHALPTNGYVPILVTVGFSIVVVGDLLELASAQRNPLRSGWFYPGFAVHASTAFGWAYVMRHPKRATIGVVDSVSMILLLTAIGAVDFHEALKPAEFVGLILAVASLVPLMRFAERGDQTSPKGCPFCLDDASAMGRMMPKNAMPAPMPRQAQS